MRFIYFLFVSIATAFMFSCGGGGGGDDSSSSSYTPISSSLPQFTSADYSALSAVEKYAVISKLTGTLFKGVPAKEFFDVERPTFDKTISPAGDAINHFEKIKNLLKTPLPQAKMDFYTELVESTYSFDELEKGRPPQYIMAILFEVPLSKNHYDMWMAYFLANTILFSPGIELDSTSYSDVKNVFNRLYAGIAGNKPIRDIVYEYMISEENWRRFRSPEDNTREMMEIFLRWFHDEDVPKAALACKNWRLTDDADGYQLVIDPLSENHEPLQLLGTTVVNCYDFYKAIAQHERLIPTVTAVVVDHLFSTYTEEKKEEIVKGVLSTNPTTFREIFDALLFSKEYLLRVERPKKWEEAFFGTGKRVYFKPSKNFFKYVNRRYNKPFPSLYDMRQAPFFEKLGRSPAPPLDALSFAYYHRNTREQLMISRVTDEFDVNKHGWKGDLVDVPFEGDDFIQYMFVSVLGREATAEELSVLNHIFEERNLTENWKRAMVLMDYFSRLAEFYAFRPIGGK